MSNKKVIVTGAAGFIGSNLCRALNTRGNIDIILVDKFGSKKEQDNLRGIKFSEKIDRTAFPEWLIKNHSMIELIFHMGARTDTTEFDFKVFNLLNVSYSKRLWQICTQYQIPLIYASSAATYGLGEQGFNDAHSLIEKLRPLNPYGESKQLFDLFVLEQKTAPPFWAGLKFFNVYGPCETHKGRMASVAYHAYNQIKATGKMKLFKSDRPDFKDGEQMRDFIFVDDVIAVCLYFFENRKQTGIYNVGTGVARTFNDLAKAIFTALKLPEQIEYVSTPADIRDKYQYFTEAQMYKLHSAGFNQTFTSLEEGVSKYIQFLQHNA